MRRLRATAKQGTNSRKKMRKSVVWKSIEAALLVDPRVIADRLVEGDDAAPDVSHDAG